MPLDLRTLTIDLSWPLDYLIPPPYLHLLPRPVSHFLGHRDEPQPKIGNVLYAFWSFVGVFGGISVIEAVFMCSETIRSHGSPMILASFGATAILTYTALSSPFSQPRRVILGQIIATTLAISITKLLALSPAFKSSTPSQPTPRSLHWLAGALSCAVSAAAMVLTDTVHPPAGATALLAATDQQVIDLGWYLLPLVLLSVVLMIATGCMVNNCQRDWPLYWWREPVNDELGLPMVRSSYNRHENQNRETNAEGKGDVERGCGSPEIKTERTESTTTKYLERCCSGQLHYSTAISVLIVPGKVVTSEGLELLDEEASVLERLSQRMAF